MTIRKRSRSQNSKPKFKRSNNPKAVGKELPSSSESVASSHSSLVQPLDPKQGGRHMKESKFRFKDLLRTKWDPKPVDLPSVDLNLEHLDGLSRSAESIR